MVLVWKINDTYKVTFDLDAQSMSAGTSQLDKHALDNFVKIQGDAALREVTGHFAYDNMDGNNMEELTLRGSSEEINEMLEHTINERLAMAGIEVVEARLNYLAYAPERKDCGRRRVYGGNGSYHTRIEKYRKTQQRTEGLHGRQPARGSLCRRAPDSYSERQRII